MCAFSDRNRRLRSIQRARQVEASELECISVGEIKLLMLRVRGLESARMPYEGVCRNEDGHLRLPY